jgi:RNA polymerase sigma-70 factor (ECF subfamily)
MNSKELENWADRLIIEYEEGRKGLGDMYSVLGDTEHDKLDKTQINSMIGTMSECIDWMKTGRQPHTFAGIDKKAAYQRKSIANMDLFQSLDVLPEEKPVTEEQKQAVFDMMIDFSPRERQCFLMHSAYLMTYAEIAEELKIGRSTVQKYVERAKRKIACRTDVVQVS